ncbi:MAG TPA: hypothetical protein VNZ64_04895 [Candidatus Acidoferrum sp.]|jgi:hypothetical protein|nr:hypothetical protein [Candidatus Acidoferrum sp.]
MRLKIRQIAFSLVLGSSPIASAQIIYDLRDGIQFASVGCEPQGSPASRFLSTGDFTTQHLALRSSPARKGDPDCQLSYTLPPSQERRETELDPPTLTLTSRVRLADLPRTASRQGWRIGGGGVLSYTTRNQRWHLVFRYKPDVGALADDFYRLHSFSVICQYSFKKRKPGS